MFTFNYGITIKHGIGSNDTNKIRNFIEEYPKKSFLELISGICIFDIWVFLSTNNSHENADIHKDQFKISH
jgi:hypothetical protein